MDRIRDVLRGGGLVVYPTDTAYGLGADPFQEKAIDRLFTTKSRPRDQPLSIAVADVPEIFRFGEPTPIAEAFCAKNLPGPYTVILRATPQAPRPIVSKDGKIALRIPGHPIPRLLSKAIGPITSTSANRHGQPSPRTCEAAREQLGDGVDLHFHRRRGGPLFADPRRRPPVPSRQRREVGPGRPTGRLGRRHRSNGRGWHAELDRAHPGLRARPADRDRGRARRRLHPRDRRGNPTGDRVPWLSSDPKPHRAHGGAIPAPRGQERAEHPARP